MPIDNSFASTTADSKAGAAEYSPASSITQADMLGGLKLALNALLELGLSPEQVLLETRDILQGLSNAAALPRLEALEIKPSSRLVINYEKGVSVSLARRMVWQGSQKILLTPNETKLMKIFMGRPHETLTHDDLVLYIHGEQILDMDPAEIARPWLSRLRQKLAALPGAAEWIESVRGVGYVFVGVELPPINEDSQRNDQNGDRLVASA